MLSDTLKRLEAFRKQPNVKKALKRIQTGFHIARVLGGALPTKEDTAWSSALKTVGLVDTLITGLESESYQDPYDYPINQGATERKHNVVMAAMISRMELAPEEVYHWNDVTNWQGLRITPKHGGVIVILILSGRVLSTVYHSPGFDFRTFLNRLWDPYEGRIDIEYDMGSGDYSFSQFVPIDNPLYGPDQTRMDELIRSHRHKEVRKKTGSYMLYGPPGSGKTSFGQGFADRIGGRLLRMSADMFRAMGVNSITFLVEGMQPDVLMIDDVDKSMSASSFLAILSALKQKSSASVIMTANDVKEFDRGLFRPGRIDTWLKFDLPDACIRETILVGYCVEAEIPMSKEDIAHWVQKTEGLTQDYLREIVDLLGYTERDEVERKITTMRELLGVNVTAEAAPLTIVEEKVG